MGRKCPYFLKRDEQFQHGIQIKNTESSRLLPEEGSILETLDEAADELFQILTPYI